MASNKKGLLAVSKEWARHLRAWGKRRFWKRERMAGKHEATKQQRE